MMLNFQGRACPVTVQVKLVPLLRIGQMMHFEVMHFLLLDGNWMHLQTLVREEDLMGISLLCVRTMVSDELALCVSKSHYGRLFAGEQSDFRDPRA